MRKLFVCSAESYEKYDGYNSGGFIIDLKTQTVNTIDNFLKSIDFEWVMFDYKERREIISNSKDFQTIKNIVQ